MREHKFNNMVECLRDLYGDICTENDLTPYDYAIDDFIEDVKIALEEIE